MFATAADYVPLWAFVTLLVTTCLTPFVNTLLRRADLRQEWARQDELEKRREKREDDVASKVNEVALKADQATLLAVDTNRVATEVHQLVNGQLTNSIQLQLDSKKLSLGLMLELQEIKEKAHNIPISPEKLDDITRLKKECYDLETILTKRKEVDASILDAGINP